jgi:hypothetical protein
MNKTLTETVLSGDLIKKIPTTAPIPHTQVVTSLQSLYQSFNEYRSLREAEKTKRVAIEQEAKVAIERIRAETEVIKDYFDKTYQERRQNFAQFFALLDRALEKGDENAMQTALTGIIESTRQSPLRDAVNVLEQIRSKDVKVIDI